MDLSRRNKMFFSPVRAIATGLLLLALTTVSACGQRGDLTLPQEDPKPTEADKAS